MRSRVTVVLTGLCIALATLVVPFTSEAQKTGVTGVATVKPTPAVAETAPFINSWFWGLKGGWMSLSTDVGTVETEPTVGIDWLITRTRGGLYLSYDQSGFDRQSSVADQSAAGGRRTVDISNLRRFSAAAMVHPKTFWMLRPYAGLGMSLQVIGKATPVPDIPGDTVSASVIEAADDARSRAALLFIGGIQAQTRRVAFFIQASGSPATDRSYLNNKATTFFEMGVRYNFGNAIERYPNK